MSANWLAPMVGDVIMTPRRGRDGLGAHLLGNGDGIGLDVAVCVVGANADEHAAVVGEQYELDFAARAGARHFDYIVEGQECSRDAMEAWNSLGPGDADRVKLGNMLFDSVGIATCRAGNDQ